MSVNASRLPLPLVSRMNGVQPCAFASSLVSRYTLVLKKPSTTPLPENHRTSLSSRFKLWVPKQVSMVVTCLFSDRRPESAVRSERLEMPWQTDDWTLRGRTTLSDSDEPARQSTRVPVYPWRSYGH